MFGTVYKPKITVHGQGTVSDACPKKKKTQNTQRKKRNTQMPPQFGIKLIKSLIIYHSNALKPQGQLLQFINFYCLNAFMHSL